MAIPENQADALPGGPAAIAGVVDDGTLAVPGVGTSSDLRLSPANAGLLVAGLEEKHHMGLVPLACQNTGKTGGALLVIVDSSALPLPVTTPAAAAVNIFTVAPDSYQVYLNTPFRWYTLQVAGVGAAATAWTLDLQLSLDNLTYTTVLSHGTADGDGTLKTTTFPLAADYGRFSLSALTLGAATGLRCRVHLSL